jgi:hypothetical protein
MVCSFADRFEDMEVKQLWVGHDNKEVKRLDPERQVLAEFISEDA